MGAQQKAAPAGMTDLLKNIRTVLNIRKRIEFTKIHTFAAAVAGLVIDGRDQNGYAVCPHIFWFEKESAIRLFHIAVDIGRMPGDVGQIHGYQRFSRAAFTAQYGYVHDYLPP